MATMRMGKPKINTKSVISKKDDDLHYDKTAELLTSASIDHSGIGIDSQLDLDLRRFFPESILADIDNPRPEWRINDAWLTKHVLIGDPINCLTKVDGDNFDPVLRDSPLISIPSFDELVNSPDESCRKDYDFLRQLALDIGMNGQIQPIEVTVKEGKVVVLEGHLRRLACLLSCRKTVLGVLNKNLYKKTTKEKLLRQLSENNLRKNLSLSELFAMGRQLFLTFEGERVSSRKLGDMLSVNHANYRHLLSCVMVKENDRKIPQEVVECISKGLVTLSQLNKIMSFKQYGRRQKEALELIAVPEKEVKSVEVKGKKVSTWRPKQQNIAALSNLLLERFPEIGDDIGEADRMVKLIRIMEKIEIFSKIGVRG